MIENVSKALINKAARLSALDRKDETLAVCDTIVVRYGDAPEPFLQERVAMALFNKGAILRKLGREADAVAAFDQVIAGYSECPDPGTRAMVAKAIDAKQRPA